MTPAEALVERVVAGDRAAIARLLTHLDDGAPGAAEAAERLAAHAGRAHVVGITGVPGSGKSTLVDALLGAWLGRGETVAVLAIDPSSPITGGAVLGDRVRMGEHGAHPNAFVRSFSARGALGGLSHVARAAVDGVDAAGFDRVVVETVGTGQSETAIAALADTALVVCPPGLGDSVQALKAGTLEIADILVAGKADLPLAAQTARELREMLHLRKAGAADAWQVVICAASGTTGDGMAALLQAIDAHRDAVGVHRRARSALRRDDSAAVRERLRALVGKDGLCAALGIAFVDGGPGRADVAMTVDARHLNFHGAGHGGAVFALADSAFGLASNSHGPMAAGIDAHITYQAAVRAGDRLVARASEVHRGRTLAVYRIDVVRAGAAGAPEKAISAFTGTVFVSG